VNWNPFVQVCTETNVTTRFTTQTKRLSEFCISLVPVLTVFFFGLPGQGG
jgi:hypothetical protein